MTVLRPGDVAVTADRMSWGILNCLNCTPTRDGAGGGAGTGSMVDLFQVFGARPDAEEVVVISKVPTFVSAERSAVPSADTSSAAAQPPVGKPPLGPPGAAAPLLENSSPRRGVLSYSPSFVQNRHGEVVVEPMAIVERCVISPLLASQQMWYRAGMRDTCAPAMRAHARFPHRRARAKAHEKQQGSRVGLGGSPQSPFLRVGSRAGPSPDYEARIMKETIPPVMRARRMSETCELNGGRVMYMYKYMYISPRVRYTVGLRMLYILVCVHM